jgi:hypothetical protein
LLGFQYRQKSSNMKLTTISLIFFLCSCSAKWHVNRAIKKDPSIKQEVLDTVRFTNVVLDTVYTSDSTFYINEIITHYDTVISYQKYNFAGLKNWFQTWQEEKTERTALRQQEKTERVTTKQENKTERTKTRVENRGFFAKYWGLILLAAIGLALVLLNKLFFGFEIKKKKP